MNRSLSLAAVLVVSSALGAPDFAYAAGAGVPSAAGAGAQTTQPPPSGSNKKSPNAKKRGPNSGSLENFIIGYEAAYAQIYDKGEYEAGIAALRGLFRDDDPDVATLIGYASRKLGRYGDAKLWYERALAADPNHAVTWSYYGMWQAEQGNALKAKDDLEKVRSICGNTTCRSYQMLKDAIDGAVTY
jgi:tetratricopeptide (TPR) repeat protein